MLMKEAVINKMAAPMVNPHAQTIRGKKGNKSHFPVKNTIKSPYLTKWPQLSDEDSSLALQTIKSGLLPHAESLAKQSSKGRKRNPPQCQEVKERRAKLRSQLAIGVNEVTRALEGGHLDLALVCPSAKPALMTNHLMTLSATRNTPTLCLGGLSNTLAPILKLNCILAIGFKKSSDGSSTFRELVKTIVAMTPSIHIPWLKYSELTQDQLQQAVTKTILVTKKCVKSKAGGKKKGKNKGQKLSGEQTNEKEKVDPTGSRNPNSKDTVQLQTSGSANTAVGSNTSVISQQQSSEMELETTPSAAEGKPMQSCQQSPPSKKRKLMDTVEPTDRIQKQKTVFKPEYKTVSILPVKIIPKAMKNKKQLKKKRKKNKLKK